MTTLRPRLRALALCTLLLASLAPAAADAQQRPGARGRPGQPLSPRDTVTLAVEGGRRIWIDYGRPYMRGRRIMGELVPFGRVWRTGANAATTLVTQVDLEIGGSRIPRGTYTLYTLPTAGRWTLIVNRQTGQWGTQYDASRDLVRIPMQKASLPRPVEQFTISLERGRGAAGTLALAWENTRVWVPFRVLPTAPPPPPARRGGSR